MLKQVATVDYEPRNSHREQCISYKLINDHRYNWW